MCHFTFLHVYSFWFLFLQICFLRSAVMLKNKACSVTVGVGNKETNTEFRLECLNVITEATQTTSWSKYKCLFYLHFGHESRSWDTSINPFATPLVQVVTLIGWSLYYVTIPYTTIRLSAKDKSLVLYKWNQGVC